MSVQNCKVRWIRPKGYDNLRAWMADINNVYIARAGIVFIDGRRFPPTSSPFANRFKIGRDGSRADVIRKYEADMIERLDKDPSLVKELLKIKGKCLGCWCAPEPCHGDVLLRLVRKYDPD